MALPKNTVIVKSFNQKREFKFDDDNNFQVIIAPVLALAQFLGLFPFTGVFEKNVKAVKFKWTSVRVIHSVFWLASGIVLVYLELLNLSRSGDLNAKSFSGVIFYSTGFVCAVFYFQLAQHWPGVVQSVARIESIFHNESYSHNPGWGLKKKIRVSSFILLLLALCEHLSSWMSFLYDRLTQSALCKWEIGSYFYFIATTHLHQVYKVFPANPLTVVWAEYMNISMTFIWSFNDLFIIIVGLRMASMFARINNRLEFYRGRISNGFFWNEIRCHYNEICELHEMLDDKIGFIVCLACLNDLYSVCLQLLNVATPLPFLVNSFYYWYSLIFVIARTTAMFFIASTINDESGKPLKVLRTIPAEGWFPETQRLSQQIQGESIAMSGKKFFFITRGIIISITGTIITYELVLLQFNADKILSGMFNPCPNISFAVNW